MATLTVGAMQEVTVEDSADEIVRADYSGGWIGGVLPALAAGRAPHGAPAWVASARSRVLLLIDGLGTQLYARFRAQLPALEPFVGTTITSVVPSTTATALPSLTTGCTPAVHGMLGDRMRVGGRVLGVLNWTVAGGNPPDPAQVQPHQPFPAGQPVVVSAAKFAGSGFSHAHLRGAPFRGYDTPDELVAQVCAAVRGGAPVVYGYLPDLDRAAHELGFDAAGFGAALALANSVIAGIHRSLPADAALLVTSDHGHVATPAADQIALAPLTPMVSVMAGNTRLRYLHARPGATADLHAAAAELVGSHAWVHDRAGLVASGWLGPHMSPVVAGRLGDVVLAARGATTLVDPSDRRQASLKTMHGSVTAAEMLVPLLAAHGGMAA